ncbi:MAG: 4-hydroxy-tetrahydrodipicolinate reductase [Myxococcota bacterium]|nr:4-hydroxy-tetrahydrodipicolinate reductase [Myxococcota bacterium]
MSEPLRLCVHGATGRMGRALLEVIRGRGDVRLVAAVGRPGSPHVGRDVGAVTGGPAYGVAVIDAPAEGLRACDVLVDFSAPEATQRLLAAIAQYPRPTVIGTTGLTRPIEAAVRALAERVPMLLAPNTSVGVAVLGELLGIALGALGPDWDVEIVELHHRGKADAPSGTALRLARLVAEARGLQAQGMIVHGRSGRVGPRPAEQVGVLAARGGDVVGEHTLWLCGPGERLELVHRAHDRSLFAHGALRAACWLVRQPPGLYEMRDVLGWSARGATATVGRD